MNSQTIQTRSGQSIYFETHGEGRPLILLMGIGYDSSLWHLNQIAAFSELFQTIVIDNRDSGQSGEASAPYQISDMADDVYDVMNHLNIDKANVLGLSMGGMIAQDLAIRHPEKLDHLILSGTGGAPALTIFNPIAVWNYVKQSDDSGMNFAAQQMIWLFSEAFNRNTEAVNQTLELLGSNPNPMSKQGYSRQAEAYLNFNHLGELSQITAHTLMISGSRDILTPPWVCEEVANKIPNCVFELIEAENASHVLPLEMPEVFNQMVIDFLH